MRRNHNDESQMQTLPSSPRRGGCAIKKMSRSTLSRADGVVIHHENNLLDLDHHPVRSIKVASQHFLDVAATPPRGGECSHLRLLTVTILAILLAACSAKKEAEPAEEHIVT